MNLNELRTLAEHCLKGKEKRSKVADFAKWAEYERVRLILGFWDALWASLRPN